MAPNAGGWFSSSISKLGILWGLFLKVAQAAAEDSKKEEPPVAASEEDLPLPGGGPTTTLLVAILTLVIYFAWLRPIRPTPSGQQQRRTVPPPPATRPARARPTPPTRAINNNNNPPRAAAAAAPISSAALQVLQNHSTFPPHVHLASLPSSKQQQQKSVVGGAQVLVDGLVAFKYTPAAAMTLTQEQKRQKAKVLARLLVLASPPQDNSNIPPPPKGSNVVVSIPQEHLSSANKNYATTTALARDVLMPLAMSYSLFVLIHVGDDGDTNLLAEHLLQAHSPLAQALPRHRILPMSSALGRVALVRQLQTVPLVVDFDAQVKVELQRFGYTVACYPSSLVDYVNQ